VIRTLKRSTSRIRVSFMIARGLKTRLNGCIVSTRPQSRLEEIRPNGACDSNRPPASVFPNPRPAAGNAPSISSATAAPATGRRVTASTTHPLTLPHEGRGIVASTGFPSGAVGAAATYLAPPANTRDTARKRLTGRMVAIQ
jgi:hypothetical protein